MKILRRFTMFVLALALFVNSFSIPVLGAEFEDVEGTSHEQNINLLYDLGIVNGKTETEFEPEATLTRAEYTTILLRLLGLEGKSGGNSAFVDVPESHWAHTAVNLAYDLRYVNGVGNGMFAPDSPIKVTEVVKMMVCALGWELKAESKGGYPTGYMATAIDLDILEGVSITADGEITRGEMATLVANSLEVEMYSHEDYDYGVNEGKTLLQYMDITKYEGQITANHMTSLDAQSVTAKGRVAMGSLIFNCGTTNASSLLGRNVTLYAKKSDTTDGDIVSISVDKLSESVIVQASEIQGDTTTSRLSYREALTDDKRSVSIKGGATLVYNGTVKSPWGLGDIKPPRGSVMLIMNDGSNADVIIVNEYKNYLVSTVDNTDGTVYLMQNTFSKGSLVLDEESSSVDFEIVDYDGSEIKVKDLKKWDVISVSESADGKLVNIIRSRLKIEGRVTATSEDSIYIDDIDYKASSDILKRPILSDEGTFYLDYCGNIAHFEKGSVSAEKYAWLVAMGKKGSMSSNLQVKLFTEDGQMLTLDTTKKVTVDDSIYGGADLYDNQRTALFDSGVIKPQLVKFRLNSEGSVTELDTAAGYETDYYNTSRYDEFSRDLIIDNDSKANGEDVIYSAGSLGSFGSKYLVRTKTKIFSIPSTGNDEDYSIISNKSLVHNGGYKNVSLYDTGEDSVVSVMVWERTGAMDATPADEMAHALVTKTFYKRDEDGNYNYSLTCLDTKGKAFDLAIEDNLQARAKMALTNIKKDEELWVKPADSYPPQLEDRVSISVVNPGDVIQYQLVEGKVSCINILFRGQTPGEYDHTWSAYGSTITAGTELKDRGSVYVGYGEVKSVSEYAARVDVKMKDDPSVTFERAFVMDAVTPILYDFDTKEARPISYEMIYPGDKILSTREQRYQRFVIVYRNTPDIAQSPNLPQVQPGDNITSSMITGDEITTAVAVAESGHVGENDYSNTTDRDTDALTSKWQAGTSSNPQWIILDLGAETTATEIGINYVTGTRDYPFWIEVAEADGSFRALAGSESAPLSNEKTDDMAYYSLGEEANVRYIKYWGKGYSGNNYVQIEDIKVYGTPVENTEADYPNDPTVTTPPAGGGGGGGSTTPNVGDIVTTTTGTLLPQSSITVTDDSVLEVSSSFPPEKTLDGDEATYWQVASGSNKDNLGVLIFDLTEEKTVSEIELQWFSNKNGRKYYFCIEVSTDGTTWTPIANMGTRDSKETMINNTALKDCYYLGETRARYIRYSGFGATNNNNNQLCEFNVYTKTTTP